MALLVPLPLLSLQMLACTLAFHSSRSSHTRSSLPDETSVPRRYPRLVPVGAGRPSTDGHARHLRVEKQQQQDDARLRPHKVVCARVAISVPAASAGVVAARARAVPSAVALALQDAVVRVLGVGGPGSRPGGCVLRPPQHLVTLREKRRTAATEPQESESRAR